MKVTLVIKSHDTLVTPLIKPPHPAVRAVFTYTAHIRKCSHVSLTRALGHGGGKNRTRLKPVINRKHKGQVIRPGHPVVTT